MTIITFTAGSSMLALLRRGITIIGPLEKWRIRAEAGILIAECMPIRDLGNVVYRYHQAFDLTTKGLQTAIEWLAVYMAGRAVTQATPTPPADDSTGE